MEPFRQPPGVTFTAFCQRQIGQAGVLPAERPRGLAVPRKVDYLKSVQ
jgi:hypothetical protein